MKRAVDSITIGICTFKRPRYLDRALLTLSKQKTIGLFVFNIIVIDNDSLASAKDIVAYHQSITTIPIRYMIEPRQNISHARNMALLNSDGDYFAGIDDDEFADICWLSNLYQTAKLYASDGVLGPVRPSFESIPAAWVTSGGIFTRRSFSTGTLLENPRDMRTGNFLLSARLIRENRELFDPAYGRTGGEDVDFFRRMLKKEYKFVWSNEAIVYELIPVSRTKRTYLLKAALLRGVVNARLASILSGDTARSLIAIAVYTLALPAVLIFRRALFMKYLINDLDHIGKVMARCGIKLAKQRHNIDRTDNRS